MDLSNINEGLMITVLGFGVVFAVLIVIAAVLTFMSFIMTKVQSRKTASGTAPVPVPQPVPAAAPQPQPIPTAQPVGLDMELVAVIAAAVAMESGKSVDELVVRNIKRVKSWNAETYSEHGLF